MEKASLHELHQDSVNKMQQQRHDLELQLKDVAYLLKQAQAEKEALQVCGPVQGPTKFGSTPGAAGWDGGHRVSGWVGWVGLRRRLVVNHPWRALPSLCGCLSTRPAGLLTAP